MLMFPPVCQMYALYTSLCWVLGFVWPHHNILGLGVPCNPGGISCICRTHCSHPAVLLLQIPNFNGLRGISFLAALMSLSYCTIATVGAIVIGKQPDAYYDLDRFTTSEKVRYA